MFSGANILSVEGGKWVVGLAPITPSTSTPDYVCLKGYERCAVIIVCDNATTVTGSAISLRQANDVSDTNGKVLPFSWVWANTDITASDTLVKTAVGSNTFTTSAVDNKNTIYVIEVDATDLDMDLNFDCLRAVTGNAVSTVVCVLYYLYPAKYAAATPPSAIID